MSQAFTLVTFLDFLINAYKNLYKKREEKRYIGESIKEKREWLFVCLELAYTFDGKSDYFKCLY